MNEQTQRISAENLSSRLDASNPRDEVGQLATTINALLARLEVAFTEQQRFIADASHELRTPVAVLRGEAEVALEHERAAAEYKESLSMIKDEAERLSRIVDSLFILARQPVDERVLVKEPLRLNQVVAECVRAGQVLATRKDLELSIEEPLPEIGMSGDDEMLARMLLNLLENAVKYTPAGGQISVKLSARNGNDTGIGIPAEVQPYVFDRFYRVDKARSRALGGAGLGLSIARWIVEAHGGNLLVESAAGKGSTFIVELPLNSRNLHAEGVKQNSRG